MLLLNINVVYDTNLKVAVSDAKWMARLLNLTIILNYNGTEIKISKHSDIDTIIHDYNKRNIHR